MKIVARRLAETCVVIAVALAWACNNSSGGNGADGGNGGDSGGIGGSQVSEGGSQGGGMAGGNAGGGGTSGGAGGIVSGGAGGSTGGVGGKQTGGVGGMAAGGGSGGMAAGGAGGTPAGGSSGNPNFGGAVFLAVGQGKTALSTDGKVWTSYADGMTPNQLEILGACILNGVAVAVNHGGAAGAKQGVWTSTNGHNFVRTFPATNVDGLPGEDCAAGKGLISAGNRYTLDQGKTWQDATSNGGVGNRGVAFGNNVFVGAGDNNIDWSADGKTWSKGTVVGGGGVTGMSHVYFGGNKFVALPYENKNPAYESTDGKAWTKTKTALPAGSVTSNGGSGAKKIFAVTSAGIYWLSDSSAPGADTWTKTLSTFDDGGIGGNDAIAVSSKHWSTDGITWSTSATPVAKDFDIVRILKLN